MDERQQYERVVGSFPGLDKFEGGSIRFRVSISTYLKVRSFMELLDGMHAVLIARKLDQRLSK